MKRKIKKNIIADNNIEKPQKQHENKDTLDIKMSCYTATQCLGFLSKMGVNIMRAIAMGNKLTKKDTYLTMKSKPPVLTLPFSVRTLRGHPSDSLYTPQ